MQTITQFEVISAEVLLAGGELPGEHFAMFPSAVGAGDWDDREHVDHSSDNVLFEERVHIGFASMYEASEFNEDEGV